MKTADIVQAGVWSYLEPVATADRDGTVTLESRKCTPVVLGGRRTAPEMVGQVRVDSEIDDELGCVGSRESGNYFQKGSVFDPLRRVEFDILDDSTPFSRESVGDGVEFQPQLSRNLLVGRPKADVVRSIRAEVARYPVGDVE